MAAPTKERPLQLQCWRCFGTGTVKRESENGIFIREPCKVCQGGRVPVSQCPQKEIGSRFSRQVNLVVHAMNGLLPDPGGVNDQDAWFVSLWNRFRADVNLIEREKQK